MRGKNGKLELKSGDSLHYYVSEVDSPLWIIAVHGIGEHLDRHSFLRENFGKDFNIFQYDLRGHGKSEGDFGDMEHFSIMMEDLAEVVNYVTTKYKMKRHLLFGHSMGGLITSGYVQGYMSPDLQPERIFLSAPPAGIPGGLGMIVKSIPRQFLKKLTNLPGIEIPGLVDLNLLSHRPQVKEEYLADEWTQKLLHSKLVLGMVYETKQVFSRTLNSPCPGLCIVGGDDRIVSVTAIQHYFSNIERHFSVDIIPGGYHELHNEIDKFRIPYIDKLKEFFYSALYGDEKS
jgi:acylglycerol lipase